MPDIRTILTIFRGSDRVVVHPPAGQPQWTSGVVPPSEVTEFYEICGGVEFLDSVHKKYADYRIVKPSKVTDIGTATCLEAAAEPPLSEWFAIGEDDNGEHAAVDLNPHRSGQCYDVFHETYFDPASARIVAGTFSEFLQRLFERGKSYWFDDGFVSRYFDGGLAAGV
jgi:cell wall assembly regulator SMI1